MKKVKKEVKIISNTMSSFPSPSSKYLHFAFGIRCIFHVVRWSGVLRCGRRYPTISLSTQRSFLCKFISVSVVRQFVKSFQFDSDLLCVDSKNDSVPFVWSFVLPLFFYAVRALIQLAIYTSIASVRCQLSHSWVEILFLVQSNYPQWTECDWRQYNHFYFCTFVGTECAHSAIGKPNNNQNQNQKNFLAIFSLNFVVPI